MRTVDQSNKTLIPIQDVVEIRGWLKNLLKKNAGDYEDFLRVYVPDYDPSKKYCVRTWYRGKRRWHKNYWGDTRAANNTLREEATGAVLAICEKIPHNYHPEGKTQYCRRNLRYY